MKSWFGAEKLYSIAHISAEGAEVSGHTLTVAAGSSPSVSLTLVSGSVEVQGIAKKAGKGFRRSDGGSGAEESAVNRDLFRRDQSDLDGTFRFAGVVPGSYTLLAIENGWDLDWSQPGVIASLPEAGRQKVEVRQSRRTDQSTLAESIEVQSK